jgi:ectoine hydroxylase-related dioxygenase (phytanoyl-CoA dioxygenase family)
MLSEATIKRFWQDGCIYPIRVLSTEEALTCQSALLQFVRPNGTARTAIPTKPYLLSTALAELVRNSNILDAVEGILGPDLLCWNANVFIKEPSSSTRVTWHQDSTYYGLSKPDLVTAWIALSDSNEANGAMEFVPSSHTFDQLPHRDTFAPDNLLTRGQEIEVDVDESQRQVITLDAGEMSLHHTRLVHKSPPNTSDRWRIGLAIRYIPTHIAQTIGEDSATLVRGEDRYGHFEHEPRPTADFAPEIMNYYKKVMERATKINYAQTRSAAAPAM